MYWVSQSRQHRVSTGEVQDVVVCPGRLSEMVLATRDGVGLWSPGCLGDGVGDVVDRV